MKENTMLKKLYPDYKFDSVLDISVDFLLSIGVKGIIFDIDNTLEPYENPLPTEKTVQWLNSIKEAGLSCAIVSNNNKSRVDNFNSVLGYPAHSMAMKPFKGNVIRAMSEMDVEKDGAIFVGDQMLTDVLAAHNAGIKAILVKPIKDKTDPFTLFKRSIENWIIRRVEKKDGAK